MTLLDQYKLRELSRNRSPIWSLPYPQTQSALLGPAYFWVHLPKLSMTSIDQYKLMTEHARIVETRASIFKLVLFFFPAGSQSDFSRTQIQNYDDEQSLSFGVSHLQIEELPSDPELVKSSFSSFGSSSNNSGDFMRYHSDSTSNFGAKFERPTELDLFGRNKRKQQGYLFNK